MSYTNGVDIIYTDPGTYDKYMCPVCGIEMVVKRNANGPTSLMGAMAGIKRKHDVFTCDYAFKGWHSQIVNIMEKIKSHPSAKIRAIMQSEIDEILQTKMATLDEYADNKSKESKKF